MISIPLIKKESKSTWKLFVIFIAVLLLYVTIILSMFDPEMGELLAQYEEAMPGIMGAIGMQGGNTSDLTSFTASYLFGFIMVLFPMLFSIILSNRLIAKYVDNGSMAYVLASPNSRRKIVVTQALFLILSNALLVTIITAVAIAYAGSTFPGELDIVKYILLNIGAYGLIITISGLGFFASCISNDMKLSYSISAGIPVAGYIIQMLANQGDKFENLKYATFFTLFSPNKIVAGDSEAIWMLAVLFAIGLFLYGLGCWMFCRRNLPL
ncbi:ABC transporter permease [Bacillus atrophaeus]|uniref:ABC transporter permease n=1 Tax=Bacillus atrophaeus TaxID=1452 RepID=UPI002161D85D|nr:ABC transporter permease [Bacillus atrophaeus]